MKDKRLLLPILSLIIVFSLVSTAAAALELDAKVALLMDAKSGRILYADNIDAPLPVASLTKMMTLTVVLEAIDRGEFQLTDVITASPHAASKRGSRIWLEAGEQMTLDELLYAIAVGSANDAAVAVAEYIAGSEDDFVALMNQRARELGLENSYFVNSSGLPLDNGTEHTMTARDVAHLARHVLTVPLMMKYVSTYEYTMRPNTTKIPVLWNNNKLLRRYSGVDGIKTGFTTKAGYCIAVTAVRDNLRLIGVILGSPSEAARERDVRTLLDWGFRRYHSYTAAEKGTALGELHIWNGNPNSVKAVLGADFQVTVERGREGELELEFEFFPELRAPLPHQTQVGVVTAILDGEILDSVPLVAGEAVERAGFFSLIGRTLKSMAEAIY